MISIGNLLIAFNELCSNVGSTDGAIHVWNSETGLREAVLHCGYTNPVHCVQFNQKFMMMVSASTQMVFILLITKMPFLFNEPFLHFFCFYLIKMKKSYTKAFLILNLQDFNYIY